MIGLNTSGESTAAARREGVIAGLLHRYDKALPGSGQPGHLGRLSAVYRNAIELDGGSSVALGGYTTTFGLVAGLIISAVTWKWTVDALRDGAWIFHLVNHAATWSIFLIGLYFEMFAPSERPVRFDRARRKVCYVHQGRKLFWLFGPATVQAREVDWDLVDCELHATLGGSTVGVHRNNHLLFLVRASATDPAIADSFVLASVEFPGALWEYIRRYMEAGMAPLTAGEAPPLKVEVDLIDAIVYHLKHYRQAWKDSPGLMSFVHLLFPLFVLYVLVNRVVVWTSQPVKWPSAITQALGVPVTEEDVQADHTHTLRLPSQIKPTKVRVVM